MRVALLGMCLATIALIGCEDDDLDRLRGGQGDTGIARADATVDAAVVEDASILPDASVFPDAKVDEDAAVQADAETFPDAMPMPVCGDDVREGSELCDGEDFGGVTCESLNLPRGRLLCSLDCMIDSSGCVGFGDSMLVYYGHGGVTPNSASMSAVTFDHWQAMLVPVGFAFTYSDIWPANLFDHRVIATVLPGARSSGIFGAAEVAALSEWLDAGGTLFVLGDIFLDDPSSGNNYGAGCDGSNALLSALGVPIQLLNFAVSTGMDVTSFDQNLWPAQGVASLPCAGLNFLALNDPAVQRIDIRTDMPLLASYARGAGRVLVISDTQCIDHMFNSPTDPVITTFVQNLTR